MMKQTRLYGVLLLLSATAMAQESDQPSDVPSMVPTYSPSISSMPSSLPTIGAGPTGGSFPSCPICPEGQVIGNPSFELPGSAGQTCATANAAGLAGNIPPESCTQLQASGPTFCACGALEVPETATPTASPVSSIVLSPSSRSVDCTASTCTAVPTWSILAEFVADAESGDFLCMCGRFYAEEDCATTATTIRVSGGKDISLECAAEMDCSFDCPHPAMIVTDGSLTITGTDQNFMLSGGVTFSRVLVEAEGSFTASSVLFFDTAAAPGNSTEDDTAESRRRLQTANGRGGGIETYGTTTVEDSTFQNCTAALGGGAIYVGGGATGITGTTFRGNTAFEGGAIFLASGSLTVSDSTFEDNVATNTLTDGNVFVRSGTSASFCNSEGYDGACSGATGTTVAWSMLAGLVAAATLFG